MTTTTIERISGYTCEAAWDEDDPDSLERPQYKTLDIIIKRKREESHGAAAGRGESMSLYIYLTH